MAFSGGFYDDDFSSYGGADKAYCSIMMGLKSLAGDLYDAIEDNCLSALLRVSGRNIDGITFVLPSADLQKKLVKKLNDGEKSGIEDLKKLCLVGNYSSVAKPPSFEAVNSLNQSVKITDVKDIIRIEYPALGIREERALKSDKKPSSTSSASKDGGKAMGAYPVYLIVRADISDYPSVGKGGRSYAAYPKTVRGGGAQICANRADIAYDMEVQTLKSVVENRFPVDIPYITCVASILNYLEYKGKTDVLKSLVPYLSYNVIATFYLIVEPYKVSTSYLIDTEDLKASTMFYYVNYPYAEYLAMVDRLATTYRTTRSASLSASLRSSAVLPADLVSDITSKYNNAYGNDAVDMMWKDEFMFWLSMEIAHVLHKEQWAKIVQTIRVFWNGNDKADELNILNSKISILDTRQRGAQLSLFVRSCYLLHAPCAIKDLHIESSDDLYTKVMDQSTPSSNKYIPLEEFYYSKFVTSKDKRTDGLDDYYTFLKKTLQG